MWSSTLSPITDQIEVGPFFRKINEYSVLASETGGSEYGGHARISLPAFLSTYFSIICFLLRGQLFVKMGNPGDFC